MCAKLRNVAFVAALVDAARVAVHQRDGRSNATGGGKGWQYGPSEGCDAVHKFCGPSEWHTHWHLCNEFGTQSPINIDTDDLKDPPSSLNVDLDFHDGKGLHGSCEADDNHYAVPKGTTLSMDPACKQSMQFEGKRYDLLQFHYHAPSEHTVDGKYYPMEVHHVHKAADGEIAVIGVFIGTDEEPDDDGDDGAVTDVQRSQFLADVMDIDGYDADDDDVDDDEEEDEKKRMAMMDPYNRFIPPIEVSNGESEGKGFYYYKGSFTTPPCSTAVNWILAKRIVKVMPEIIEQWRAGADRVQTHWARFDAIMRQAPDKDGDEVPDEPDFDDDDDMDWNKDMKCNNRPIQPTGSRRHVFDVN